jgi:hypothetical protein
MSFYVFKLKGKSGEAETPPLSYLLAGFALAVIDAALLCWQWFVEV